MKKYVENMKKYEGIMKKYEGKMKEYQGFPHTSSYFLTSEGGVLADFRW